MDWKLFLDDKRFPKDNGWIIARSFHDAVWCVKNYGIPKFISFDHDLGLEHFDDVLMKEFVGEPIEKNGYDFAKWLVNHILDYKLDLPEDFSYYVHSMNPIGANNINKYMLQFIINYKEAKKCSRELTN